jgi:hypothetical protein
MQVYQTDPHRYTQLLNTIAAEIKCLCLNDINTWRDIYIVRDKSNRQVVCMNASDRALASVATLIITDVAAAVVAVACGREGSSFSLSVERCR